MHALQHGRRCFFWQHLFRDRRDDLHDCFGVYVPFGRVAWRYMVVQAQFVNLLTETDVIFIGQDRGDDDGGEWASVKRRCGDDEIGRCIFHRLAVMGGNNIDNVEIEVFVKLGHQKLGCT